MYADEMPDFATPVSHPPSENQPAAIKAELCKQAFDACLQALVPRLGAAKLLDGSLLRPFRYCHRTWRDGAVAFRQELIEVSNRWKELELANPCPYSRLTPEELLVHQRDFESFQAAQELKRRLMSLLDTTSDGWVPSHLWEATKIAHREAFDELIRAVRNSDEQFMSEEELKRMWPFDIQQ